MCRGRDLQTLEEREMRAVRGSEIAMIFQEPMTSLNPAFTVGNQIAEAVRIHEKLSRSAARQRAIEMLDLVGIPDPHRRDQELSARVLGRDAPAGHDRDGAVVRPAAA